MSLCCTLEILLRLRSFSQGSYNLRGNINRPVVLISRYFFFCQSIAKQYIPDQSFEYLLDFKGTYSSLESIFLKVFGLNLNLRNIYWFQKLLSSPCKIQFHCFLMVRISLEWIVQDLHAKCILACEAFLSCNSFLWLSNKKLLC